MPKLRIVPWSQLTKRGFDRLPRERCLVLVTCSPLEVHGPHLPIGADILEGRALAHRALERLPERLQQERVILEIPPICVAADTLPQPGSLVFRPRTVLRVLGELARTLAAQGFRDVIVTNFHGGPRHVLALEAASDRASRRFGLRMVSIFSVVLARIAAGRAQLREALAGFPGVDPHDLEGDMHAGLVETSQLLALHPDWVDPDYKQLRRSTLESWLAERGRPAPPQRVGWRQAFALLRSYRGTLEYFMERTYAGAPAGASAELGERFLDTLAGHAAEACADVLEGRLAPTECHSPLWPLRHLLLNPVVDRFAERLLGVRNPIA